MAALGLNSLPAHPTDQKVTAWLLATLPLPSRQRWPWRISVRVLSVSSCTQRLAAGENTLQRLQGQLQSSNKKAQTVIKVVETPAEECQEQS